MTGSAKSEIESSIGSTKTDVKGKEELDELTAKSREVRKSISDISRIQRNMRTNEHRNMSVVKDAENRLLWFAIFESAGMFGLGYFQVYIIKTFFSAGRTRV